MPAGHDEVVGRAKIISQDTQADGTVRYEVRIMNSTEVYILLAEEVAPVLRAVHAEGRLILRPSSFYVAYHLIPD